MMKSKVFSEAVFIMVIKVKLPIVYVILTFITMIFFVLLCVLKIEWIILSTIM